MSSLLPSAVALGLAALAALALARGRTSPAERHTERLAASRALAISVLVQSVHFAEEAATGLPDRLGAVFGLGAMPETFFLAFNLLWLAVWVVSVRGVRSGRRDALFAAWFLAIAGMLNGVVHPALALVSGGYFPGLVTSPVVGAVCVWLWLRLRAATE